MVIRLRDTGWGGLTRAQSLVLTHLDREGTRPSDLARRMQVTRQAVHGTLRELGHLGLVELAADPTNKRAKRVVLTPRGKRLIGDTRGVVRDLERELEGRIGRKRVARLRRALESDWGTPPTGSRD